MTDASETAEAMRKLSPTDRRRLIVENADKVIGHTRFDRHRRQAELSGAYRKPSGGGVA